MRRLLIAGFLAISIAMLGLSPVAEGQSSSPAKGQPSPPEQPQVAACKSKASGHKSSRDEWLSCINVTANLSKAPAVGETATLTFDVSADVSFDAAQTSIELPSNLEFVRTPGGMRASRASGGVSRAVQVAALPANSPQHFEAIVRATAPGSAQIRVRTTGALDHGTQAGNDDVFLTVGATPADSKFGIDVPAVNDTAPLPAGAEVKPSGRPSAYKAAPVAPPSAPKIVVDPSNPGTACAVGSWTYQDQNGTWRPSVNVAVQAWDDNTFDDGFLGTTTADGNGNYSICFNNAETGIFPFDSGTVDLYVKFITQNTLWRVRVTGTNNDYVWQAGPAFDIPDGNFNFGALTSADASLQRGLHAFDEVNDAWWFISGSCWDPYEYPCRQVVVNWSNSSVDGTYYSLGGNDVHLAADDPNAAITVVHETAHAIMDDNYNDAFPPSPNCNPHSVNGASSQGCAWTEGWAEWFPASVYDDPFFRWPNGASIDLETPTWGTGGWPTGDSTEGRIAGAMIDISDFSNEAYWDRYGEGDPWNQWATFYNHVSNTFNQFWGQRAADGFNVASSGALASVYQNTIDYGFRDPLGNYAELSRPTPTPHNYGYNTSTIYWSVVAIRPPFGSDYDLTLYDDFNQGAALAVSAYGGNVIDFVAVDSNRRALGDYYPRVTYFSGAGGNYQIELAQGSNQAAPRQRKSGSRTDPSVGTQGITMGSGDVVAVRDTLLNAGIPVFVRVVPGNGGQDAEVLLMGDDANSATWVRGRSSAIASSSSGGPGAAEAFSATPSISQWYGLVLLNKAGSGTYSLYVDTSAPTGTVSINGGAAATNSTSATLSLGAADAETGVSEMRVSTDGVMDSETYVPYAASAGVTLPAGDGTKTVLAQFKNNAGMTSSVVSDTILLDTAAPSGNVITAPTQKFLKATGFTVSWTAADLGSGVASYDVRYRQAAYNGSFGSFTAWQNATASTSAPFVGVKGTQYCFSVRARDSAGNVSGYSAEKCAIVPLDDRALTASAGWTRSTGSGYFQSTFSTSSTNGATLTSPTLNAKRLGVLVTKCPGCGTIEVRWNGTLVGTFSLNAASVQKRQWLLLAPFASVQTGTLTIRVSGSSPVEIDGIGAGRK